MFGGLKKLLGMDQPVANVARNVANPQVRQAMGRPDFTTDNLRSLGTKRPEIYPQQPLRRENLPTQDFDDETLYDPRSNQYLLERKRAGVREYYDQNPTPIDDPYQRLRSLLGF